MKIIRIVNPAGISYLKNYLLPLEEYPSVDEVADKLQSALMELPSGCFFAGIMNDADDAFSGFILALLKGSSVLVFQSMWGEDIDERLWGTLMLRFLFWCEQSSASEVKLDSRRNDEKVIKYLNGEVIYSVNKVMVDPMMDEIVLRLKVPKEIPNALQLPE